MCACVCTCICFCNFVCVRACMHLCHPHTSASWRKAGGWPVWVSDVGVTSQRPSAACGCCRCARWFILFFLFFLTTFCDVYPPANISIRHCFKVSRQQATGRTATARLDFFLTRACGKGRGEEGGYGGWVILFSDFVFVTTCSHYLMSFNCLVPVYIQPSEQ